MGVPTSMSAVANGFLLTCKTEPQPRTHRSPLEPPRNGRTASPRHALPMHEPRRSERSSRAERSSAVEPQADTPPLLPADASTASAVRTEGPRLDDRQVSDGTPPSLLQIVPGSSERTVEPVRQDSSFAEKQESPLRACSSSAASASAASAETLAFLGLRHSRCVAAVGRSRSRSAADRSYCGHARMASSMTRSSSSRVAPDAARTAMPQTTVPM